MSAGSSLHSMHAVEQEKPRSRVRRILYFVPFSLLMIAVLVMTGIGVGAREASHAETEQRRDAALTQPSQESSLPASCVSADFGAHAADIWTGERNSASERIFSDHSEALGMRVEGRDGFEFLGDQQSNNFSQALGRGPWLDDQLAQWLTYFDDLDEQLSAQGRDLVIVVAPAKWELYPEKLPEWSDGLEGKTHLEQFLEHSGDLPVVDVRSALSEAKRDAPVYSAVNPHWTPYGAYAAWAQTVACAAEIYPGSIWSDIQVPSSTGISIETAPNEFAPYGNTSIVDDWARPVLPAADDVESTITGPDGAQTEGPADGMVWLLDMPASTSSASGTGRALIMRDSTGEALAPLWATAFAHTCQERHNLDDPSQRPDVVARAQDCDADTVLFVFTERYFSQMPPSSSTD